jgi:DNA-binding transcriptional MerR regulator
MPEIELLSFPAAAQIAGVGVRTVRHWARHGLSTVLLRKQRRVEKDKLLTFLQHPEHLTPDLGGQAAEMTVVGDGSA